MTSGETPFIGPVFDSDTAFEVHVETLFAAADTLERLAGYAEEKMYPEMLRTLNLGTTPGGDGNNTQTDLIFGTFAAAQEVAGKQAAYYQSAKASTEGLVKALRDAAEGTKRMAENYRNAEEASKAAVQDVERILAGGDSTAPQPLSSADSAAPTTAAPATPTPAASGTEQPKEGGY